jgi:hypothetical protein
VISKSGPDVERLHQRDQGFHPWAAVDGHVDELIHDGTHLEGRRSLESSALGPPEPDLAFDERYKSVMPYEVSSEEPAIRE